ncbi:MAG: BlaI/MecI/CopY family transcriptional regulator [Oscillospiraceae bacterium]|nr:BlaI/MecI/CopY family transcriptional regulator [Oscillospiraceae bacterium]
MEYRLGTMEYRFLTLIWENEPINSTQLMKMCAEKFSWKKSTSFTMIKKLQEKGYIENKNSIVTSLVSQEAVMTAESKIVVTETFKGSLPKFVASFLGGSTISEEEAEEIKKLIDSIKE